ncbi:TPA: hypothetical protein QCY03_005185 [Bacillus tropicus]|nr:hypothetical protein [Bacillus tropicus]
MHYSKFFQPDFDSVVKEGNKYFVRGEGFDPHLNRYYEDVFVLVEGAFVRSRFVSPGADRLTTQSLNFIREGVKAAVKHYEAVNKESQ